ncbi:MAG TPA: SpoIIE family protein phosphatase, partial [Bacteroidia bacterium]|nr:SpoIIE family protein phosphatase [Bacteroidia bacterium]
MKKSFLFIALVVSCCFLFGQNKNLDSLWSIYKNKNQADTIRFKASLNLTTLLLKDNPEECIRICLEGIEETSHSKNYALFEWKIQNNLALTYANNKNDIGKGISTCLKNKKFALENKLTNEFIITCRMLGKLYSTDKQFNLSEASYDEAINSAKENKLFTSQIEISCEKLATLIIIYGFSYTVEQLNMLLEETKLRKDKRMEFRVHHEIVELYYSGNLDKKEMDLHAKAELAIAKELNDKDYLSNAYFDMGLPRLGTEEGTEYFKKSLTSKINRRAGTYNNIALGYINSGKPDLAKLYVDTALQLANLKQNLVPMGASNYYLSRISFMKEQYPNAIQFSNKGLELWKKANHLQRQYLCTQILFMIYRKQGDYKKAIQYLEETHILQDSFAKQVNSKEVELTQNRIEFQKVKIKDSLEVAGIAKVQELKLREEQATNKQQKQLSYFLYGGLGILLVFGLFIYNRYQLTNKQKSIIAFQKHLFEEKNKEIMDSINYAVRIQKGILPSESDFKNTFKNSFIYFKPKDIVSGDFYWFISIVDDSINKNIAVFAAADCTGHGVPGAFMSMLNNTLLNQTVYNSVINSPADALNFLNKELPKNLKSFDLNSTIKDGMDIAICLIDFNSKTLKFAGANNPCWIVRNNSLIELKPLKQAITATEEYDKAVFTDEIFSFQKEDSIYLFTDGYSDQFGGPKGKKFKHKQLKEL